MCELKSWMVSLCLMQGAICLAQPAPGEDPLPVGQKIQRTMVPLNLGMSSQQPAFQEIPAWMDAKLARFQAKAFAADTSGIWTDENVVTRYAQDGLRKVCTQNIASNSAINSSTPFNRYGPKPDSQIVVLRRDLINICR